MSRVRELLANVYLGYQRWRLRNESVSLISNNCNGGFVLHDLRLPFRTPTINLYIPPRDFIRFVSNLDAYLAMDFVEKKTMSKYPVAMLGDIEIHFVHYLTLQEAINKWRERAKRINKNNLFIIMAERDGCTYEDLLAFDALPYPKKIVFTHQPYPAIKSAYWIKDCIDGNGVGYLYEYRHKWSPIRYMYDFDFVKWFNSLVM